MYHSEVDVRRFCCLIYALQYRARRGFFMSIIACTNAFTTSAGLHHSIVLCLAWLPPIIQQPQTSRYGQNTAVHSPFAEVYTGISMVRRSNFTA